MFSTDDLKDSICRWLADSETHMSFSIEQHQCELIKARDGINCLISVGAQKSQITPALLLQLTQAGLNQFPGTPVLSPEGQYMLAVWQPVSDAFRASGDSQPDGEKLLAVIETLSNQAAVWNELLANNKPAPVKSPQSDMLRFSTRLSRHPMPF